jgi:hypothetical protein
VKQNDEDLFGIEVTGGGGNAAPDAGRTTERQSTRRSTSDEAHRSADVAATRKVMLDLISQRPRTCDEIVTLGFAHQSASAAINWLMRQGRIVPSGEKRKTRMGRRAIVWRHEENPQPLVRTRPTRRDLEQRIAAALDYIGEVLPTPSKSTLSAILRGEAIL